MTVQPAQQRRIGCAVASQRPHHQRPQLCFRSNQAEAFKDDFAGIVAKVTSPYAGMPICRIFARLCNQSDAGGE
jgi:hypothetical protein